jgi:hypothetical protein
MSSVPRGGQGVAGSSLGSSVKEEFESMPEFFVPGAASLQEAEKVWQATKKVAEEQTGWIVTNRRIFRLEYTHGGRDYVAEVGQTEPRTGEPVLVILGSNAYLVCTRKHGVARGEPLMVGGPRQIVDFN